FSSRRRHTRSKRDWSSDVCSSDLDDGTVYEFEEKPKHPKSNKASMGIYIFKWSVLKAFLEADEEDPKSENDFGKNIIPNLLATRSEERRVGKEGRTRPADEETRKK